MDVGAEGDGLLELQQGNVAVQHVPPVVPGVNVDLLQHGDLFNASLIPAQTPKEKQGSHKPPRKWHQFLEEGNCLPSRSGSQGDQQVVSEVALGSSFLD